MNRNAMARRVQANRLDCRSDGQQLRTLAGALTVALALGPLCLHASEIERLGAFTGEACRGVHVRRAAPDQMVFMIQHPGSYGPTSAWKMTLDRPNGNVLGVSHKQVLGLGTTSDLIFESANGDLLTGSGWLGNNYPHRSLDGGETWTATGGEPRWSTYDIKAFGGRIYDATGYGSTNNKVHRYNSAANAWETVFQIGQPRVMTRCLGVHGGQMFVGTHTYSTPGGGVPVYVTSNGVDFQPTTGIDGQLSVLRFLDVGGEMLALVQKYTENAYQYYRWTGTQWEYWAKRVVQPSIEWVGLPSVDSLGGILDFGQQPNDPRALYRSTDLGRTWSRIADYGNDLPYPTCTDTWADGTNEYLYFGTYHDASGQAYVCRVLVPEPTALLALGAPLVVIGRGRALRASRRRSM